MCTLTLLLEVHAIKKGNTPTSFTFSAWPYAPVLRTVELRDRSVKFLQNIMPPSTSTPDKTCMSS
jgi:hypothetical protein